MSLQVWLPLNGDLHNQGLHKYPITIFRGTETYNNQGKIGKCFYSNGVNTIKILDIIPDFQTYISYSLCAWFYIETNNTTHSGSAIISAGDWNSQVLNLSLSDWSTDHYTRLRVSGTNWNNWYNYNFNKNTWYHVVVCSDGNKTYAYVNGNLIGDTIAGFLPSSISGHDLCIGGATYYGGMQFFGKINDARIYNHCLSAKEVEEISKGLILHYKLNNNGLGNSNLLSINESNIINSTRAFEFQGWVQNFYTKTWMNEHLIPGKKYTLSYTVTCLSIPDITIYSSIETRNSPILVHQGGGWNQVTTTNDNIKTTNMQVGEKRKYICTFTFNTATESQEYYGLCGYSCLYRNPSNSQTQYAKFRIEYLQLEEGTNATPWSPHSSELDINNIVYDSSGYNNNGQIIGSLETIVPSPKYHCSTYINSPDPTTNSATGEYYISANCSLITPSTISISWWSYPESGYNGNCSNGIWSTTANDIGSDYQVSAFNHRDNGFDVNSSDGTHLRLSSSSFVANAWHHYVVTYDGQIAKLYKDGVQQSSIAFTTAKTLGTFTKILIGHSRAGGVHRKVRGKYLDFRIYVTALTEAQVKELYRTSMNIDGTNILPRDLE